MVAQAWHASFQGFSSWKSKLCHICPAKQFRKPKNCMCSIHQRITKASPLPKHPPHPRDQLSMPGTFLVVVNKYLERVTCSDLQFQMRITVHRVRGSEVTGHTEWTVKNTGKPNKEKWMLGLLPCFSILFSLGHWAYRMILATFRLGLSIVNHPQRHRHGGVFSWQF